MQTTLKFRTNPRTTFAGSDNLMSLALAQIITMFLAIGVAIIALLELAFH